MALPVLSGLQVLEWGQFVSAPYCARLLADLGAEVTKIEEPGVGDEARQHGPFPGGIPHPERSGLFLFLNTNKLGITLNPRSATGRGILLELLKEADVFVTNAAPPLMEELELSYPALREANPRLVATFITPYGLMGPYRDYKAYDINIAALSGTSWAVGRPDREPLALPFAQCSYQAGAHAATATLVALLARLKTGRGQSVDASEADAMAMAMGTVAMVYTYHGMRWARAGHRSVGSGGFYPCTILPCRDGFVHLICRSGHEWKRFVEAMGFPEWTQQPRYRDRVAMGTQYPDEVDALLVPWFRERTKEEILALCREKGIPFAPVRDIQEVMNDPHLAARGFFVAVEHAEAGVLEYPSAFYQFSQSPWRIRRPAPLLGEHNEAIFCRRLGYSKEELAALRRAGVI